MFQIFLAAVLEFIQNKLQAWNWEKLGSAWDWDKFAVPISGVRLCYIGKFKTKPF